MIHTAPRMIAIGAVAAAALALSGCAFLAPPERFSDEATLGEQVHTIEIDQPAGSVTVRGDADATEVEVARTVSYRGDREVGTTFEIDGDVLVLSGCGRNCTVDYTIALPAGVDVRGATSNGTIELTKVGEVDVSTNNGRIELDDVAGTVEAETSNGRIEGRGLAGTGVRASTSNGAIELRLDTPQDVDARTSNGAIDLAVPTEGAGYRVTADTSNGDVDIDIDEDSDGEFTLDLVTSNGAIRVTGR
ncbi:hypothetical protein ASE14_13230 [Agromyces sp. Root81]|uniref:DUF4097 family beta strand repeat-containing protein n=1 Tax=Agromyces sp. Root81 TaxID=1736601 RepID=UPI0006F57235|nr:DUF4097 family beta strand repeat-containing protein [Agromyces sp. Root81]KRC61774.1 hypothetical protein ASE14_13230 [Agromyces sp. Root81]